MANIKADATRYTADARGTASRDVAGIKAAGVAPGFNAIQRVFPDAQMTSGVRSVAHNREVGGVADSTHLGQTPGTQGYRPGPASNISATYRMPLLALGLVSSSVLGNRLQGLRSPTAAGPTPPSITR